MKIRFLVNVSNEKGHFRPGDETEKLDDKLARQLVRDGHAELASEKSAAKK